MGIFTSYTDKCPKCGKDVLYDGGLEVDKHVCKPTYRLEKIPIGKLKHNDGFKLKKSDDRWYMFDKFLGDYNDYIGCYVSDNTKYGMKDIIISTTYKYVYKIILLKDEQNT